jgi:hypothetical protein
MSALDALRTVGFVAAGEWVLEGAVLTLRLHTLAAASDILYAFLDGDAVLYIGVSTRTLGQRMRGYARPGPTQRTNLANHARLTALLSHGHAVSIWVFAPTEVVTYRVIALNIAAGLEGPLIARLRPPWNRRGRHRDVIADEDGMA